ncbi:hypothetical protein OHB56_00910 [Streptomyces sp. NBC_01635]|nr:hypothetical protein OHB56_00910 [Streptomyces sp. NBC_01635]
MARKVLAVPAVPLRRDTAKDAEPLVPQPATMSGRAGRWPNSRILTGGGH